MHTHCTSRPSLLRKTLGQYDLLHDVGKKLRVITDRTSNDYHETDTKKPMAGPLSGLDLREDIIQYIQMHHNVSSVIRIASCSGASLTSWYSALHQHPTNAARAGSSFHLFVNLFFWCSLVALVSSAAHTCIPYCIIHLCIHLDWHMCFSSRHTHVYFVTSHHGPALFMTSYTCALRHIINRHNSHLIYVHVITPYTCTHDHIFHMCMLSHHTPACITRYQHHIHPLLHYKHHIHPSSHHIHPSSHHTSSTSPHQILNH